MANRIIILICLLLSFMPAQGPAVDSVREQAGELPLAFDVDLVVAGGSPLSVLANAGTCIETVDVAVVALFARILDVISAGRILAVQSARVR